MRLAPRVHRQTGALLARSGKAVAEDKALTLARIVSRVEGRSLRHVLSALLSGSESEEHVRAEDGMSTHSQLLVGGVGIDARCAVVMYM